MSSINNNNHNNNSIYNELSENENLERLKELCGERKLLAAVLDRAFLDLRNENYKIRKDAENWFNAKEIEDPEVISFQFICELFKLNIPYLRNKALCIASECAIRLKQQKEIVTTYVLKDNV
jgi:hypothetical protein